MTTCLCATDPDRCVTLVWVSEGGERASKYHCVICVRQFTTGTVDTVFSFTPSTPYSKRPARLVRSECVAAFRLGGKAGLMEMAVSPSHRRLIHEAAFIKTYDEYLHGFAVGSDDAFSKWAK